MITLMNKATITRSLVKFSTVSHSLSVKKYFCSEISAGEQDTKKTKNQSLISQYSFKNALYPINVTHSAMLISQ